MPGICQNCGRAERALARSTAALGGRSTRSGLPALRHPKTNAQLLSRLAPGSWAAVDRVSQPAASEAAAKAKHAAQHAGRVLHGLDLRWVRGGRAAQRFADRPALALLCNSFYALATQCHALARPESACTLAEMQLPCVRPAAGSHRGAVPR